MTNGSPVDDGAISDIPWASVFDPVVNVRALGEIQARGFRAATDLVDRFVHAAPASTAPRPTEVKTEAAPTPEAGQPAPDGDELLAAWQRILGQAVQSVRGVGRPGTAVGFDFTNAVATGHLDIAATALGTASAEVWLHNSGAIELGKVRLRCGDLLAHDGSLVPAAAVRFDPDPVDMPARSSRGVTVAVDVEADTRPGHYRGILLADGYPDIWLPLALDVSPP